MCNYLYLFDLDSTITKVEILPEISKMLGVEKEIRALTEETMQGIIPFKHSFLKRVDILGQTDVDKVREMIAEIPLNEEIADFIRSNHDNCYVVTGNLDVWIEGLLERLNMIGHCYCSKAMVENNKISKVISVIDKGMQVEQIVQPFVAVGDGDNDSVMAEKADIGIGFGAVREIAPSLMRTVDYAFYEEKRLVEFLNCLNRR